MRGEVEAEAEADSALANCSGDDRRICGKDWFLHWRIGSGEAGNGCKWMQVGKAAIEYTESSK